MLTSTPEALTAFGGVFESRPRHPLLGARVAEGSPDWRNLLDPLLLPWLADHRVNGAVVAPAAGLIEMALAAGRDLHGGAPLALHDFDVLNALVVSAEENLESATDDQELDFFVVYSSATTVIGSPGQSAYVAANAFLEGFAHRRRAAGKPALAIGWGALSDVGLIARDRKLGDRLERTTGVVGVRSDEALAHLGRLLALGERVDPLQFYTMIAPGPAAASLALLRSPASGALVRAGRADEPDREHGDLRLPVRAWRGLGAAPGRSGRAYRGGLSQIARGAGGSRQASGSDRHVPTTGSGFLGAAEDCA